MSSAAIRSLSLALALGLARGASAQAPVPQTASAAVEGFMHAIRDSNLTRMADLFGTNKGPFSQTRPSDYQKKIMIMQLMLGHIESKALAEVPIGKTTNRSVTTEIAKGPCKVTIAVTAVQYKGGWLVHDFPLEEASVVNKPCSKPPGNSGG